MYRAAAYLALCLHWFNPLVWLAFYLSGKDMEMSCDEAVIRKVGNDVKREYSNSLLTLATGMSKINGVPLAFGEGDTGRRIKNVLRYKKPAVILVAVAMILCLAAAVFLLGNPKREAGFDTDKNHELQSSETIELPGSETIENDAPEEQTPEQIVTLGKNEVMEGVSGHELSVRDMPDDSSDDEWDSYGFIDIESGQYALSDITCEIKEGKGSFNYVISWDPTGNFIRVGLINEVKSDMYYVTCVGGVAKSVIDISQIPAGNYYVIVYNDTSSSLVLNGAIAYNFTYN